jgi:hypothetical protein
MVEGRGLAVTGEIRVSLRRLLHGNGTAPAGRVRLMAGTAGCTCGYPRSTSPRSGKNSLLQFI